MKPPIGTRANPLLEGRFAVALSEEYASPAQFRASFTTVCPLCGGGIFFLSTRTQVSRAVCKQAALRFIRAHEDATRELERDPECESCQPA